MHMSGHDRAAQFSPFAALTGYDDEVREKARLTEMCRDMTDDECLSLDQAFQKMISMELPKVTIGYFEQDRRKNGGKYLVYSGVFRFYDAQNHIFRFTDGMALKAEKIRTIDFI